jgi:site-specific recombinase XerD
MTLSDAVHRCLQNLQLVQKRSPRTLSNYGRTMSQYQAYVQGRALSDDVRNFNTDTVSGFVDYLAEHGRGGSTIHNKIHGLSALKKYLSTKRDGRGKPILSENPCAGFERPDVIQPAVKFLEPEEFQRFLSAPANVSVALARDLLVDTWIRRLEAIEANAGDLKQVGDVVYLSLAVKGRRHGGEQRPSIPLSTEFAERLWQHLQSRQSRSDDPLLLSSSGHRWKEGQLTCAMIRLGAKAGITRITTSPHVLRHTLATIAATEGVDRVTLAALLNHRGLQHVDRYTHLVPGRTAEVRENQGAMVRKYLNSCVAHLPLTPSPGSVSS